MTANVAKKTGDFLLRLREKDTPTAISGLTLDALMTVTGMTKTELAHLALRRLADSVLPRYEKDDGPLTEAQLRAIRELSTATDTPEECFTERLI